MAKTIQPGLYRHYKGKDYEVFNIAHHSETEEPLVIYRCLYGDYSWWARPLSLFKEAVTDNAGNRVPRFRYCGPIQAQAQQQQQGMYY